MGTSRKPTPRADEADPASGAAASIVDGRPPGPRHAPAVIVAVVIAAVVGLSLWYLPGRSRCWSRARPTAPASTSRRASTGGWPGSPVARGQNVAAGTVLVGIDNPELVAKLRRGRGGESGGGRRAGAHQGRHPRRGHRPAQGRDRPRRGRPDPGAADLRPRPGARGHGSSRRSPSSTRPPTRSTWRSAAWTRPSSPTRRRWPASPREEHGIAQANVAKAEAAIATLKALVDQLSVTAPIAAQVYRSRSKSARSSLPGVPLLSLVDLADIWLRFDLREDLVRGLKVGDRFAVRVPALGDRERRGRGRVIAAKGEYAGWRATRATGDFDLRTFEIRAYPVDSGRGPAARDERLHRLDGRARVRPPRAPRAGCWSRRARCAGSGATAWRCFLLLGVPLIAFAVLGLHLQQRRRARARRDVVDADRSATSRLFVQTIAPAPGIAVAERADDLDARDPGDPLRRRRSPRSISRRDFERDLLAGRRPQVVAFYNAPVFHPRQHRRRRACASAIAAAAAGGCAARRGRRRPGRAPGRWWSSNTC